MAITASNLGRPPALRAVSCSVAAGELLVVTGDHGTGKSTLLSCLAGLDNTGELSTTGATWLVPAEPAIDASLTVNQLAGAAALERWGLTEHAEKLPHMLSRGTATKVQLAQAFSSQADNYLFDEPFNGLDRRGRELFVVLVSEVLAGGACAVVATHDVEAFDSLPHRMLTLS